MSVRRVGLVASLLAALLGLGLVGRAAAGTESADPDNPNNIKVSIQRAKLAHVVSPNYITMDIVVRNADGSPPRAKYTVFMSFHEPGKDPTDNPARCQEEHFNDRAVPRGVYRCVAIVDKPGLWQFDGTVGRPGNLQQILKTVSVTLDLVDAVILQRSWGDEPIVQGKTFDVVLRQAHVALAGLWLLLVGALGFLALPRLRSTLSARALGALEARREFVVALLWGAFAGALGTGLYLLNTQVPYHAPFSTRGFSSGQWSAITTLPYARAYFLALYGKILVFMVMAACTAILQREAARHASDIRNGGSVVTAVRVKRGVSIAAGVLLGGVAAIAVAVTVVTYLHALIESGIASTVLGAGG